MGEGYSTKNETLILAILHAPRYNKKHHTINSLSTCRQSDVGLRVSPTKKITVTDYPLRRRKHIPPPMYTTLLQQYIAQQRSVTSHILNLQYKSVARQSRKTMFLAHLEKPLDCLYLSATVIRRLLTNDMFAFSTPPTTLVAENTDSFNNKSSLLSTPS